MIEKLYHANTILRRTGVPILILETIDFRTKNIITTDIRGHFTVIKGSNLEKDIRILNVYAPNNRASHYMGQKLTELPEKWKLYSEISVSL